ncbi:MAG: TlpA disulfide reductase family protein [Chitinophagales bacterium]
MNLLRRCSFLLLFFALGVAFVAATNGPDGTPDAPTKTLPNLNVKALGGDLVNIVEHYGGNGKITVFSFWATWCAPCKKELGNIADIYEEWQDLYNVEVVAVSTDDAQSAMKVQQYVDGKLLPFDVLLDSDESLKQALGIRLIPHTIVTDQEGNIVYEHTGYSEGDEFELEDFISELNGDGDGE